MLRRLFIVIDIIDFYKVNKIFDIVMLWATSFGR